MNTTGNSMDVETTDESSDNRKRHKDNIKARKRQKAEKALKEDSLLRLQGNGADVAPLTRISVLKSSPIWTIGKGFTKYLLPQFSKLIVCELCVSNSKFKCAEINYGDDMTTTAPKSHFKIHHEAVWEEYVKNVSSNVLLERNASNSSSTSITSAKSTKATEKVAKPVLLEAERLRALCKLIVHEGLSISIVESESWCGYIHCVNAKQPPLRSHAVFRELVRLKNLFEGYSDKMQQGSPSSAMTCNTWTLDTNEELSLYVRYFVDAQWCLQSVTVACGLSTLASSASASSVSSSKALGAVTFSTMEPCILVTNKEGSSYNSTTSHPSETCFCATLAAITDVFLTDQHVEKVLAVTQKLAIYLLYEMNDENIPNEHVAMIKHIQARSYSVWWATYKHLHSIVSMKPSIMAVSECLPTSCKLEDGDWNVIQAIICVLQPFMHLHQMISEESFVGSSVVIPFVSHIRDSLQTCIDTRNAQNTGDSNAVLDSFVVSFATSALAKVTCVFGSGRVITSDSGGGMRESIGRHQLCATALDIRTKSLTGVREEDREYVWNVVCEEAEAILSADVSNNVFLEPLLVDDLGHGTATGAAGLRPSNAHSSSTVRTTPLTRALVKVELQAYREMSAEGLRLPRFGQPGDASSTNVISNVTPLQWWKKNESVYPQLAKLAMRVLSVPASACSPIALLSPKGMAQAQQRKRFTVEEASTIVWLQHSWWSVEEWMTVTNSKWQ